MAADFGHTADAVVNRGHKAGRLYLRACHEGLLELPADPDARRRIRKDAGLPRDPSAETWELAGRMLDAWPPARSDAPAGTAAVCGCTVDEDGLLYEHLPADRDAAEYRFEGWLCPHNCPVSVYLGEPREVSRIPTVDDQQRAAYALEAVTVAALLTPAAAGPGGTVVYEQAAARPRRFGQCDDSCTVDCGHCKGAGPPPVNPHRITVALDRAGLQGPTADAKLGAVEPDLDNWEAGRAQPTAGQLRRLAGMANVDVGFFYLPDTAEPKLTRALVHLGGRKGCQTVITMLGEPADPPQAMLNPGGVASEGSDWWQA